MSNETKQVSDDEMKQGQWYVVFDDGDTYSHIDHVSLMCVTDDGMEENDGGKIRNVSKKHLVSAALLKKVFNDFLVSHTYSPLSYTNDEATYLKKYGWTEA